MRRVIKELRCSYITPRPIHYKQDKALHEDLKKNLVQKLRDNPDAEVLFSDEARFGTHSKLGHGWFETGSKTPVKVKLGYKNFYIYGCASPITGKSFTLLLPKANTAYMNLFLNELSKEFNDRKVILIVDGAGWHKSKGLVVPGNIELVYLPPYNPKLNPIERLWQYIKKATIRNRIYKTIDELEEIVCDFINELREVTVRRICNLDYLFSYNV